MHEGNFFEIKKNGATSPRETFLPVAPETTKESGSVVENFFEEQRQFLEWYAGDSSIRMRSSEGVQLPDGQPLTTFAIDLEAGVMYGHPKFFETELGYSPDKALFAYLHEFEHFRELRSLLSEREGRAIWQSHQKKIKDKQRYHILDNCFDDVKMNRTVVRRVPTLSPTRKKLYTENLFPERDLTTLPKHLQFAYILNCEQQETGERWQVADDVRAAMTTLEALRGKSGVPFIEYASSPNTPMSVRLRLQETIIEPVYDRFFVEDVAEKKSQEPKSVSEATENKAGGESGASQEGAGKPGGEKGEQGREIGVSTNPEDFFQDEYAEFFRRYRHATSEEKIDEAVAQEIKRQEAIEQKEGKSKIGEQTLEAYARTRGVNARDLQEYRHLVARLETLRSDESDDTVIEELRAIFRRIVTERKRMMPAPEYPLPEGDILSYPAEAVVRTRAGEAEPDVWENIETRERREKEIGNFDVILVGDVSISMQKDSKATEQRLAMTLILEALQEFIEELETLRPELRDNLSIRTGAFVFGSQSECLKPLSPELTEKERVAIYKRLGQSDGQSTKDFLVLEQLLGALTEEEIERIQAGKLKKLVLVMSDGESADVTRVQQVISKLREQGVTVIGIGITASGGAITTTYTPEAQLAKKASDLPYVLAELLKKHLADL